MMAALPIVQHQPLPPANLIGALSEFTPYTIAISKSSFITLLSPTKTT